MHMSNSYIRYRKCKAAHKMKFSIKDPSKCDRIRSFRRLQVNSEAALQRFSKEKVFGKYAANLQKNTHAEV